MKGTKSSTFPKVQFSVGFWILSRCIKNLWKDVPPLCTLSVLFIQFHMTVYHCHVLSHF